MHVSKCNTFYRHIVQAREVLRCAVLLHRVTISYMNFGKIASLAIRKYAQGAVRWHRSLGHRTRYQRSELPQSRTAARLRAQYCWTKFQAKCNHFPFHSFILHLSVIATHHITDALFLCILPESVCVTSSALGPEIYDSLSFKIHNSIYPVTVSHFLLSQCARSFY